jgi:hypothetical protein
VLPVLFVWDNYMLWHLRFEGEKSLVRDESG